MTDLLDAPTLVDRLLERLVDAYVFPERAAIADQVLRGNLRAGRYDSLVDEGLCERLNEDLFEACRDKHLRLIWHSAPDGDEAPRSEEELVADLREQFRLENQGVYVLVSSATFSGGEELAYDLKALGRATIVGEVTRGGAHPSAVLSVGDHVELRLPVARTVNPITGGNWEAVGVAPDIPAPADDAFDVAYRAIVDEASATVS
jgi:hypothetical protein